MRKKIMLLGKSLITFCLLWPIPVGLIIYFLIYKPLCVLFNWMVENENVSSDALSLTISAIIKPLEDMPLWGISHGYWWPLLYVMVAGLALCLFSRYVSKGGDARKKSIKDAPLRLLEPFILIGFGIVIAFWVVTLIVIGLYHLFLTNLIAFSVPALFGLIIVGLLVGFGVGYRKHYKK